MPRPRKFDEQEVIARALDVFWESGYEATSVEHLEEATGLQRSSLYNAFGGKTEVFSRTLDAYSAGPCIELARPLEELSGAAALLGYFAQLDAFLRSSLAARGCLMVNTGMEGSPSDDVERRVDDHFRKLRIQLRRAYADAVAKGQIPRPLQPGPAADWLITFVRGLLAGAASGQSTPSLRAALQTTIEQLGLRESGRRK